MLFEGLGRDHEPVDELRCRDHRLGLFAARCEEIREERLEQPEPLRRDRARGPVGQRLGLVGSGAGDFRRGAFVALAHSPQACGHLAAQLVGLERNGAPVEPQHPGGEMLEIRVRGDEDVVLESPGAPEGALHPPGGVARELDSRFADDLAHLPRRRRPVRLRAELRGKAKVALPSRREADLAADPRDAERPDLL